MRIVRDFPDRGTPLRLSIGVQFFGAKRISPRQLVILHKVPRLAEMLARFWSASLFLIELNLQEQRGLNGVVGLT
jgi:hypothetical protein